jgi:hypothetical protein
MGETTTGDLSVLPVPAAAVAAARRRHEHFRCASADCASGYEHPVGECDSSVDGHCAHLMGAGWRPVWLRVMGGPEKQRHLFSQGGWLCPTCAARYL